MGFIPNALATVSGIGIGKKLFGDKKDKDKREPSLVTEGMGGGGRATNASLISQTRQY